MTDEKALLAAIWEDSHDDTPRLVYADWLEEHGGPAQVARGEFIRVQCELARLTADDPRRAALKAREKELWATWKATWRAAIKGEAKRWPFHRGFPQPDDRGIYAGELFRLTPRHLAAAPARGYCVLDAAARFDELLAWPGLARLDTFYLRGAVPSGDWVARALACAGFRNVRRVSLIDCPITPSQLETLLTAWKDRPLVDLQLNGSKVGDDGLRMVLDHPVLATVRGLGTTGCDITAAGVRALAQSRLHPADADLSLAWNPIGDEGLAELLRWPGLERITKLGLNTAQISDAGAIALAGCAAARGLRKLWLGMNRIGGPGAAAIAASPHLRGLTHLYLHDNPLPAQALQALRARFGKRLKSPKLV
jgi:uncharacterized protein (TIGR02996 family)